MSISLIDYPHFVTKFAYEHALSAMIERLIQLPQTVSVYKMGSIGSPGISDIDVVVVFKENQKVETNFLKKLSLKERYLFVHALYGISKHQFEESEQYTFFNNFTLLHGTDLRTYPLLPPHEVDVLKKQVAIEYLVKMCINIYLQHAYRVLRVRDLLLHVKALEFDCDFLGIRTGRLLEKIFQIIEWRKTWFNQAPSKKAFIKWWNEFYEEFHLFFKSLFNSYKFYFPYKTYYRVTKNILLLPTKDEILISKTGVVLPEIFSLVGKRYFNLQNKLNNFRFEIPITTENIPPILEKKFLFEKKHVAYNRKYLPNFFTLNFSLHVD
jgi:hypothetical protein